MTIQSIFLDYDAYHSRALLQMDKGLKNIVKLFLLAVHTHSGVSLPLTTLPHNIYRAIAGEQSTT